MEVKRIEVVKKWFEPKLIRDIKIILGFANFYWQFIQGFSKIAAPLTLIQKTTILPEKSTPKRLRVIDNEVNRFDIDGSEEIAKKSEKFFKSWKSAKLRTKSSKIRNLSNFSTIKTEPTFLTSDSKTAFYHLWLAFIETLILWNFDTESHIRIETDALGYAIGRMLSQLIAGTSLNEIIIKTNLN